MNYPEIRPYLRSGDLLLCSGTSWFSRLIQAATGSEWSHVGLVLRLERLDRVMVLESVESVGVRAVPLSRYFSNYSQSGEAYPGTLAFYRHRQFPDDEAAAPGLTRLGRFAVDRLGWPYDGQQIAEIAARLALHHLEQGAWGMEREAWGAEHGARSGEHGVEGLEDWMPDGSLANQAYICSEYVAACYAELGLKIECGTCPYVSPGDFVADPEVEFLADGGD